MVLRIIPDIPWTIQLPEIGAFRIYVRRNRGYWLHDPLTNEGFMLGALQRAVRPGDVIFDVGANAGLYTRCALQCFQAARVIAFEPVPENVKHLKHNLRLGAIESRVQIVPTALAESDGQGVFQKDNVTFASGTLDAVSQGEPSQSHAQYKFAAVTITVDVATMDSLVSSGAVPPPAVIKLDVEGAEAMVLRGGRRTLAAHQPIVVVELHGAPVGREVVRLLWDAGYTVCGYFRANNGQPPGVYQKIGQREWDGMTDFYSLHHLIAAVDPTRIADPIEPFAPTPK